MIEWKEIAASWLSEYATIGVFAVDPDLKIRFWNRWMADHTGKSAKFVMGKPLFSICPEIQTRKKSHYYRDALSGKTAILSQGIHHYLIPMPAGCTTHSFECMQQTVNIVPLKLGDQVISIVTIIEDVTERLDQEQDLTISRDRYRILVENARDAIFLIQGSGVLESNPAARSLFGLSGNPEDHDPDFRRFREAIDPNVFSRLAKWHGEELDGESLPELVTFQISDRTGKKRWMESNTASMTWEGKPAILTMLRDITRRKEAEMALEAERKRLAVTLRSIGDGVIATDTEGRVILINRAAEKMTGWSFEETLGEPLPRVFHIINQKTRELCENPVEKVLETGQVVELANHTVLITKDGGERMIADSGSPIKDKEGNLYGVVLVFQDVTEKYKMEAELARTRNLESLGLLAGGIAHDFNNILAVILGNLNMVKLDMETQCKGFECTTEAERAALQAKGLALQLLTFAKGGAPVKKTAVLSETIRDTCGFAVSGSNVRCEYAMDEALWPVDADVEQMGQVLNNLCINAKQAMPRGGAIRVSARNERLHAGGGIPLEPGPVVVITIRDEGTGIPKEYLARIFDPYFTTKQTGSGLGLATAHSIIQKHGGHISAASTPGEGTTFTLYLPASSRTPVREAPAKEPEPAKGGGRVLIMDDDPGIGKMTTRQLERLGYGAVVAKDGAEALLMYEQALQTEDPFTAVIMDLTIPGGMGGKEAVLELLKLDPNAVALVSSGYANDPVVAQCTEYGFKGAISKPFTLNELGRALEAVLKKGG